MISGCESKPDMSTDLAVNSIVLSEKQILIQWTDNHRSNYDSKYLRLNCECAECVEEWSKRKLLDPKTIPTNIKAEDYLMVGRYAVQFLWSDAHYTGIYPFDVLRKLCPCEDCKSEHQPR